MADLLAQGYITIAVVNDGYSLSLTTSSVSIPANHDGSDPDLSCAYTNVSLSKGNVSQPIEIINVIPNTNGIQYTYVPAGPYNWKVSIIGLASDITSGYLDIIVRTPDGYQTSARFNFSVVRNTTSLDWIEEWNGTHTQIGSNYVITPKLFAGHKTSEGKITGIYLGKLKGFIGEVFPFTLSDAEEGLYGYRDNKIVFYIDNNGARIGGWDITPDSIQCLDGTLTIKSEGAISSQSDGIEHWALKKDGSASFANGKVTMDAKGNASFDGHIIARSGELAGWTIGEQSIYKVGVAINSSRRFIAAANVITSELEGDQFDWVKQYGGVAMYYISNADYGFVGYKGNKLMFASGSRNFIAGWNFDESALYIGTKNNNLRQFTQDASSITIGTNGIRGYRFYLDKNGAGALAGGNIIWDETGKVTFSKNVSLQWSVGIENAQNLAKQADAAAKEAQSAAKLAGDKYGQLIGTYLTRIGTNGIYTGTLAADQIVSGTMSTANIKQSKNRWSLNQDGSGILANGNISWDQDGNVTFGPKVTLNWTNAAQQAANAAKNEAINTAKAATDAAKKEVIDRVQKAADAAKNEAIGTAKKAIDSAKGEAISSAKQVADAAKNEAISSAQKAAESAKNTAISTAQRAVDAAKNEAISTAKKATDIAEAAAKELASAMALGKMLYRDPTFIKGTNSVAVYNNTRNSNTVTITRSSSSTVPNDSGQMLTIQNTGTASPNCGGFAFATACGYKRVFITRIIAKIPVGRDIAFHSNDLGPEGSQKWLTSTKGTGNWQEYICKVQCGTSKFSSTNYFSITGSFNVTWYLAYATVFDVTSSERYTTTIDANGIYTGSINARQITAGTINADRIAVGSITTSKIAANAITADRIAVNSITTDKITSDAITTDKIAANAITTDKITANAITTSKIAANAITGNKIAAHTITSDQINADSIKANIINTNYINGLRCTFTQGTIGGWSIGIDKISKNTVSLGSDGSISNGLFWSLANDGSGFFARGNITWKPDGTFEARNGKFTGEIQTTKGTIGGFQIASGRIGVSSNSGDTGGNHGLTITQNFIKCSDVHCWASIGTNVLPTSSGIVGVGRFTNSYPKSYGVNFGLLIKVSGAPQNIGISSSGAIVCDSYIADYGISKITPNTNNCYVPGETTKPTLFRILVRFINNNAGIGLPRRDTVCRQLGISNSTPFAVKMTIICDKLSTMVGYVCGRNSFVSGNSMNNNNYPYILNQNADYVTNKWNMGKGDMREFMLVWDGSYNYYAYLLNVSE